jgi:SAM-dependent methyltransferase
VPVTDADVLEWLRAEWAQPFRGWDFSYLHGRRETVGEKSWDLETVLRQAVATASAMVDLGTGDGRFLGELLASAGRPARVCATEGYPPNAPLALERLRPLGVGVVQAETGADDPGMGELPFLDGAFDLLMSRHTGYRADEVARVLRAGGRLVTQQVGDRTNVDLHTLLGAPPKEGGPWNAAYAAGLAEAAGLRVLRAEDGFTTTRYRDVGAIAWYLKAVSWEVPDFTVDRYAEPLLRLHRQVERTGQPIDVGFHVFLLVADKP